jgi:hypothetical protein
VPNGQFGTLSVLPVEVISAFVSAQNAATADFLPDNKTGWHIPANQIKI